MNIIEILDEVGHTKLEFQYLHECWKNVKTSGARGRQHTLITFGTQVVGPADFTGGAKKVGVIVWMPAEDLQRALGSKSEAA